MDVDVWIYIFEFLDYGYKIMICYFIYYISGVCDNFIFWELVGRLYLEEILEEEIFDMICW